MDENQDQNQDPQNPQDTTQKAEDLSPMEARAREMGWVPAEDFEGDPQEWVTAEVFVARKPLFDTLSKKNKEVKELRKAVEQLQTHYAKVEEHAYKRAIEDLRMQKKVAIREQDFEVAEELDEKIDELREQQMKAAFKPQPLQPPPEIDQWMSENKWYVTDPELKQYADIIGKGLIGSGKDPGEVLETVTKEVKARFPDKFRNPNRDKAPSVETKPNGKPPTKGKDYVELTDDERKSMNTFIKMGVMSKEEYIDSIRKLRGA